MSQWNHLLDMVSLRKNRLDAAVRYHQLFADADDIDNWMLDTLRYDFLYIIIKCNVFFLFEDHDLIILLNYYFL